MTQSAFHPIANLPRAMDGDPAGRLYLAPTGMVWGAEAAAAVMAGSGWPVAGGNSAFTSVSVILREGGKAMMAVAPFTELMDWSQSEGEAVAVHVAALVRRIGHKRKPWAGFALDRPVIMGIVNATPDSFSDGGDNFATDTAIASALGMVEAGADIIDVGGESTRPGAAPISIDEEARRVLPVVRALAERNVLVSIDTRHAAVMDQAVSAGAAIINDVTALAGEGALAVAARSGAAICLMHMQGEPRTMQTAPRYECAPLDVFDILAERVTACEAAGIERERIAVDPGIGFGKAVEHNVQVLAILGLYHGLGCPILLGVSRKSFIGRLSQGEDPKKRLPGTLAAELAALDSGVQMLRVHDVPETNQAVRVWRALRS